MKEKTESLTFRQADPQTVDYDRIAELINAAEGRNINADALRSWDASQTAEDLHKRYVACRDETVIGYGVNYNDATDATSRFLVWLTIDKPFRKQGYGGQFYLFLEQQAIAHGATGFGTECMDNDGDSLSFAEKRGYKIQRHWFASHLDLTSFDTERLLPIVESVREQGVRFTSLAAEGNTEAAQRKLFTLNSTAAQDNPGNRGEYQNTFENYRAKVLNAHWFRAAGQILAVIGEQFVGLAAVGFESDGVTATNAFTGVDRAYRGRKIAQALKVLAALYAQQAGAQVIITSNDSESVPMLAVNDRLGYVRQPGPYWLEKARI